MTVTFALADLVLSAALIAVTVTVAGDGSRLGARYVPPLIVPTVALPPETPFTLQVTAVFEEFVTVAVNCRVRLRRTLALVGEMLTFIDGGFTSVTAALPTAGGETEVSLACTFTVAGEGTVDGAV